MDTLIKNVSRLCLDIVFVGAILAARSARAHDWPVHTNITTSAFISSAGISNLLNETLESPTLTATPRQAGGTFSALEWLRRGSKYEDEETYWAYGQRTLRCIDHFYTVSSNRTPGAVIGMNDNSEAP